MRAAVIAACFSVLPIGLLPLDGFANSKRQPDGDVRSRTCESSRSEVSQLPLPTPIAIGSLPNAYWLHQKVISGGQPAGQAGFRELRKLGVRTVISVDGAKPELALARKYGLRYVHLPHGYDGIPEQRVRQLAKAVSHLPGPIYIHCHHGRHRSPAAAAVACIGAGLMTRENGLKFLDLAGTNREYRGLHQVVASAKQQEELGTLQIEFRAVVDVPPLATAMVRVERTFDNLKLIEKARWSTPTSHPDLSAVHEALLLREHFAELLRTDEVPSRPPAFLELLRQARTRAESLERQLKETTAASPSAVTERRLSKSLSAISKNCKSCHRDHRD